MPGKSVVHCFSAMLVTLTRALWTVPSICGNRGPRARIHAPPASKVDEERFLSTLLTVARIAPCNRRFKAAAMVLVPCTARFRLSHNGVLAVLPVVRVHKAVLVRSFVMRNMEGTRVHFCSKVENAISRHVQLIVRCLDGTLGVRAVILVALAISPARAA